MAKTKFNLQKISIPEKIEKARQIVTDMTGNSNFTNPLPTLAAVTAAINDLEISYNATQTIYDMTKTKTEQQNTKKVALNLMLTQLGNYVENASGGDVAKIKSSGMDVRRKRTLIGEISQVPNLSVTAGDKDGEIDLHWDKVRGANSYIIQKSPDPLTATSFIYSDSSTKSSITITGLISGTKNWFRVAAIGASGQGPWSDPAVKIVP
ncbi:MAG: fibronectin type III domain-containing protein [Bacteroidota bacterium]